MKPKKLTKILLRLTDPINNVRYIAVTADSVVTYNHLDIHCSLGDYVNGKVTAQDIRDGLQLTMPKGVEAVIRACQHLIPGWTIDIQRVWSA